MSWIRQGTISTTNGSTVVNGVDCLWSIGISPGASLYLVDGNGNPTAGPYEIASIQSNTRLTLAKPFPGTTGSARAYAISNTVGDQTVSALANDMTKFYGEISELLDQPQVTPVANSIPVANSSGKIAAGWIPDATTTAKGVVELATTAEAQAGTDATRAVTPAGALAAMQKYGLGVTAMTAVTVDANTLTTSGVFFLGSASANLPRTSSMVVEVKALAPNNVIQTAYRILDTLPEIFHRVMYNNVWGPWTKIPVGAAPEIENLHVTSTDDATSATAAPLKTAGGLAVAKDAWVGGDIYQPRRLERVFRTPAGAGTYKIILQSFGGLYDLDVTGRFDTKNRSGFCSYKIHFSAQYTGPISFFLKEIVPPTNNNGSFGEGFSVTLERVDTSGRYAINIMKPDGAAYDIWLRAGALSGVSHYPLTEFIPA